MADLSDLFHHILSMFPGYERLSVTVDTLRAIIVNPAIPERPAEDIPLLF